jgi:hypothetical protein
MNFLSIEANLYDYKTYLVLITPISLFRCEVKNSVSPNKKGEISDEDLMRLRKFLNEIISRTESISNENP